jgi:acyl dehydratase
MDEPLHFEDLQVGMVWRSRGRTVTEADIVNFAGLTGDYDPLHVDREFAKQTPFGQPVAHGLLGLSLVAGLGSHFPTVQTVAFVGLKNWEFLRPVFIGDTVHAVNEVSELRENGHRRGVVVWKRQLVKQSGEIVQQGYFETLVAKAQATDVRAAKPPAKSAGKSVTKSAAKPAAKRKSGSVRKSAASKPRSPRRRTRTASAAGR